MVLPSLAAHTNDPPPGVTVPPNGKAWIPPIPLVGSALNPIPNPARGAISKDAIKSGSGPFIALRRLRISSAIERSAGFVDIETHRGHVMQLADAASCSQ